MVKFGFSKKYRICRTGDFQRIFHKGKRFHQAHLTACSIPNALGYRRLGISIGKKFGKAHDRNRFKRLVRESFRQLNTRDSEGMDIVIIPNNACKTLRWDIIAGEIKIVMEKGSAWVKRITRATP